MARSGVADASVVCNVQADGVALRGVAEADRDCVVRCMQADGVVRDVAEAKIAVGRKWRRGNGVAEAKCNM